MPQIPGFGNLAMQNPTTHILDVVHFPMVGMWAPQNPSSGTESTKIWPPALWLTSPCGTALRPVLGNREPRTPA